MLREMLKTKIHRATVTKVDLRYEGSLSVDQCLMEAAGIVPYEAVHVWNISNGQRLQTYALPAPGDSGEICLNGAAARLGQPGDKVIIASPAGETPRLCRGGSSSLTIPAVHR